MKVMYSPRDPDSLPECQETLPMIRRDGTDDISTSESRPSHNIVVVCAKFQVCIYLCIMLISHEHTQNSLGLTLTSTS